MYWILPDATIVYIALKARMILSKQTDDKNSNEKDNYERIMNFK